MVGIILIVGVGVVVVVGEVFIAGVDVGHFGVGIGVGHFGIVVFIFIICFWATQERKVGVVISYIGFWANGLVGIRLGNSCWSGG